MTESVPGLAEYAGLIGKYRTTLDLLSERGHRELQRLLEEAVTFAEAIEGLSPAPERILDLGSGAGLPGIPIALKLPAVPLHLVERRRRRASFLRIVAAQLGLGQVEVHAAEVESITVPPVDTVTSLAVGEPQKVYALTRHLHSRQVWLVSRRGPEVDEELSRLEAMLGTGIIERREEDLAGRGRLLAVLVPGGIACPPSG